MFSDPSIDRRGFLASTAATACTTALAGASVADASSTPPHTASPPSSLCDLACGDFADLIGSSFHVAGTAPSEASVEAKLVLRQAKECDHPSDKLRPSHVRPAGFSLLFEASAESQLASGTHWMVGGALPACQIYLHSRADVRYPHRKLYEAVFN